MNTSSRVNNKDTDKDKDLSQTRFGDRKKESILIGLLAGFFIICMGFGAHAFFSLNSSIAPIPDKFLSSQHIHQSVLNARTAIHNARNAEDKDALLSHLASFRQNLQTLRETTPSSFKLTLPSDDDEMREILNDHANLTIRLNTYLYVIDNAHKEFQDVLSKQTDKAYFDLVMETDRDTSVSRIVNNYVTPLVSTTQLGTDVNLIVANLEKAGAAEQKGYVQNIKTASDNALKRINAAFSLHHEDRAFAGIEDITFQIVSFAHGPNNVFEIKQRLLDLESDLIRQMTIYDQAFADILRYSNTQRAKYAGLLYNEIDQTQRSVMILMGLNLILFVFAVIYAVFTLNKRSGKTSDIFTNFTKSMKHLQNTFKSKIFPHAYTDEAVPDKESGDIDDIKNAIKPGQDKDDLWSSMRRKLYKKTSDPLLSDNANHKEGESIKPLLLDTTMRIEAQRQKLKKALSELDDVKTDREKTHNNYHHIDDIVSMIKENEHFEEDDVIATERKRKI